MEGREEKSDGCGLVVTESYASSDRRIDTSRHVRMELEDGLAAVVLIERDDGKQGRDWDTGDLIGGEVL